MAHVKRQLLEYLIRECIREVLDQVGGENDTIGAPAPPSGGLGTADQPTISPGTPPLSTPTLPTKGIVIVNPRDKSKLQPISINYTNDAKLERDIFRLGAGLAGPKIKISLNAMNMIRDSLMNPSAPVYVFIGKYDPESEEVFVMADRDINVAKENSASPTELGSPSFTTPSSTLEPMTANAGDFASRMASGGKTVGSQEIDELKKAIKNMVREVFSK